MNQCSGLARAYEAFDALLEVWMPCHVSEFTRTNTAKNYSIARGRILATVHRAENTHHYSIRRVVPSDSMTFLTLYQ